MWDNIRLFFNDSETIFWARLQMFLGLLLEGMSNLDLDIFQPVFGNYFPWFLAINGVLTEYLRRRRMMDR